MTRPKKLDDEAVTKWLAAHAGWEEKAGTLVRALKFPDYARSSSSFCSMSQIWQ